MIPNEITINNLKGRIIFLITCINSVGIEATPGEYKKELRELKLDLQEYISQKEYDDFFSGILEIPLLSAVEEAEEIIENLYKNRGQDNGRN